MITWILSGLLVLIVYQVATIMLNKGKIKINKKVVALFYIIAIISFALDYLTKYLAESNLSTSKVPLLGNFLYLKLTYNDGAAFSILSGNAWVFTVVAIVFTLFISYVAPKINSSLWALTLGMLFGGLLGNLFDRLFRAPYYGQGSVVDFIGYGNWFVGNVADIFIVVSIIGLILLEIFDIECIYSQSDTDSSENDNLVQEK
ncbi:signal peptidase II [Actinomyces sp. zg-332]|uniref:signal peptidase II n=1 Tax=Actinomyces sp. zg-332 TaxID=2708340 RepID=UPI001E57CEB4|nr:signal peptidase II [Actinomyces sp. zg-332]